MKLDSCRILIVKPSSLGDVVHTLPLVHAIKRHYPGTEIHWLVQRPFAPLLAADSAIDEIVTLEIPSTSEPGAGKSRYLEAARATMATVRNLLKRFRERPCDLVLDLHASFRSALFSICNPGGIRVGFEDARELNPLFMNHLVVVPKSVRHAIDKNLLFCDYLACPCTRDDFYLPVSDTDKEQASAYMEENALDDSCMVYCNPAARWASKHWPVKSWAELADRMIQEKGLRPVLAGSQKDRSYLDEIADCMRNSVAVCAGSLGLGAVSAMLNRSRAYIGLDSGPMHMAAMAGIPVIALFGPTNPDHCGPYGQGHTVIRNEHLDCLGCRRRQCPDAVCLSRIGPDRVLEALCSSLGI